ncbi:MAG: D-amino acid dehydrogenase [Pseudomonadota bacterium]
MANIAVIGAGITGITTAYCLRKKGFEVTVFDRNRYPAMETSYANGGQLSASNAEVWNHPATLWKGVRWLFDKEAPLSLSLKLSFHKYSWFAEFVGAISQYEKSTADTVRMALIARAGLLEMAAEEGIHFHLEKRGILHFYKYKAGFKAAAKVNQLLTGAGLDRHPVSPDDIKRIEPALAGNFYGGFFTPSDMTGDIHAFTTGLAEACKNHGVGFQTHADISSIRPDGVRYGVHWSDGQSADVQMQALFDAVVICAGVHSRGFARQLGDRVNVYPVKGYSITVEVPDNTPSHHAPFVSLLDDEAKIVTSRLGRSRYRVAGTAEFNGYSRDIRADRIAPLVRWVERHHPQLDTRHCVPWCGLRPMMPNMLPRVGPGRRRGVFYNTGHGHLGWTLSAATAHAITNIISHQFLTRGTDAAAAAA